ncbi:hypothetical protein BDP55DRAFT_333071 [Colletotrichum godetiae]|uniref:Methyltransferase domain-containing protein n=1 Tax=Colletotrichum godetiae TaxID=1209918 RepID=A0AAJ0AB10_9PEZI|nr:uncharacterized protein BDP55DRAFT_333071 [Colletotrichum godetiae]KAK1659844.1 hypothetical protein BDP55DRAFT_333071 [Colletotrichum godetiae]
MRRPSEEPTNLISRPSRYPLQKSLINQGKRCDFHHMTPSTCGTACTGLKNLIAHDFPHVHQGESDGLPGSQDTKSLPETTVHKIERLVICSWFLYLESSSVPDFAMAVPSATRQYPKNDTLAKAWDLLNHTLEIGFGHQSWSSVPEVKLAADFPTNSAIWLTRAAEMRATNGLANAQFIGYRDPQLHPRLDSLDDDICLEVDPSMMWKERKYDLIHSRVIGYIENWPEYLRNVQSCLATAGVLHIEVVEMIPFTDEGSLPETSPLLKLSRIFFQSNITRTRTSLCWEIGSHRR